MNSLRHCALLYTMMSTLALTLVGCASGPHIGISAYSMDARFQRDCVGPNAPYTMRDRECQQKWEPHTQPNQVHRVPRLEELEQWQRDILQRQRCRATGEGCPEGLK
jgi:hypothetical protein